MLENNLKNIVVLKNVPSNLIDEAIFIVKSKKTAKKLELAEKNSTKYFKNNSNNNDYIIKEAENVVSNYINKVGKNKNLKKSDNNIEVKYRKIKAYSIFISVLFLICIIRFIF